MTQSKRSKSFTAHIHPPVVSEASTKISHTWCMGGLALWFFMVECITGALLAVHYIPGLSNAYPSVLHIAHAAPYGFFIRNVHYWAGQMMVIAVLLHMIRVFVTGSYQSPRKANWLIGVSLLLCTFLVDFTGYLLIWDDRALWACTIARNLAAAVPLIGSSSASIFFGPEEATDLTLVRIYLWHILLWPATIAGLTTFHFWKVRKDGISVPL